MGSWNTTCGVSATPIVGGNHVRLFFLASNKNSYDVDLKRDSLYKKYLSYPYSDFQMIGGLGIKATYYDYGRYEFDENTIESQHILNTIKENYVMNLPSKGRNEHVNIPAEKLNFEKIQEMIHDGNLYLSALMSDKVLDFVTVMAVHEDVYQVLINEVTEEYSRDGYNYLSFDDVLKKEDKRFKEWEKRCKSEIEKYKKYFPEEMDEQKKEKEALNMVRSIVRFGEDYEKHYSFRYMDNLSLMTGMLSEFPSENSKSVLDKITEAKHFVKKLEAHNLMLRPTVTSGQTYSFSEDAIFLNKIADAIASLESNEDYIPTKKCSQMWQEINYSDLESYFVDGWGVDPEENEYWVPLQTFKEKYKEMKKVLLTPEEFLKKSEYNFIKEFLLNKELDVHIIMDL